MRRQVRGARDRMFPVQNTAPSRYPPLATWGLIAVNCAIFLVQIRLPPGEADALIARFALIPARYCCGNADLGPVDFLPFFTMMFLHGGWLHLILNMWALWVFGGPVEDRLGPARYLLLYLACGVIAALTHYQFNPTSPVPALGASGAIGGVIGCYVRLLPFSRIIVVIPILFFPFFFDVPAIVFVGILVPDAAHAGHGRTPHACDWSRNCLVGARRGLPRGRVSGKSAGPAEARASTLLR